VFETYTGACLESKQAPDSSGQLWRQAGVGRKLDADEVADINRLIDKYEALIGALMPIAHA
jgi:hypothetical protein